MHRASILPYLLAIVFVFGAACVRAADHASTAWKDAVTAYTAGDYEKALAGFKTIAEDEKQISAALCHNIGNCEFKLDHRAAASIWYRRAVALDRSLAEARQNVRFIHRDTGFKKFESWDWAEHEDRKLGFWYFFYEQSRVFSSLLKRTQWISALEASVWALVIAVVWLVWAPPRRGRRWPVVTLLCAAALAVAASGSGLIGKSLDKTPFSKRIVSLPDKNAFARSAPAEAAGTVIDLPPGSELFPIRPAEGNWIYCKLPAGDDGAPLRGWVRTNTTEPLWPWNPALVD